MTGGPFVISASPVSRGFREQLERDVGGPIDTLTVMQLRRLPVRSLLRTLRKHRGRPALLALEDEAAASILPIMHALALVAGATSVEVVGSDRPRNRRTPGQLVSELAGMASASAAGAAAYRSAQRELAALAAAPRLALSPHNLDRVLFLNTNMWFGIKAGGSLGHIAGVVNGFVEQGLTVDLASTSHPVLLRPEVRSAHLHPPRAYGLPRELNVPRFQRRVVRELLAEGADNYGFLYQRLSVGNFAGVILSRAFGLPLVLEYNGSEAWAARHWGTPLRFESAALLAEEVCLKHAHVVVTVSQVLADELVSRGVHPDRVVWYPNGVDAARYDPTAVTDTRAELGIAPDAIVIGFIGTFGHWHGAEVLARAFGRFVEEDESWVRDRRVHLLLVGDGDRMPEVVGAARGRAGEHVTMTGLVPQADGPRYLASADILASPHVPNADGSPFFGSPTKLFEYMAMGRAIIASDLEQIGAVLQPSLNVATLPDGPPPTDESAVALLVAPGDVEQLRDGLRFLVEHRDWRARLGENARARVLERHTWAHHVGVILDRLRQPLD